MRLKDQVALITGGGTGIGRGIALAFAREGGAVVVNYSKSRDRAEETARQIDASSGQALTLQGDVSKEANARRLVDLVVKEWGRLDILVNSAGWTKAAWLAVATGVGASRVFLNAHFLSDVLGDALIGWWAVQIALALVDRFMPLLAEPTRLSAMEAGPLSEPSGP
ncbi:MAG: SDR family NAD(P)-dependent oxidoreductase [Candidatus Rokuibacteriota bacterium]